MATFDMVFEGGGAKGIALSGAVGALRQRGHQVGRLVGTSAGAITATNLAIGYHPEEILTSSKARTPEGRPIYTTFDDPPTLTDDDLVRAGWTRSLERTMLHGLLRVPAFASTLSLVERGGLHRGDAFLAWMQKCLEDRGPGYGRATFAELHEATGVVLSVVTTDSTGQRMLVLNHRTAPRVPVAWGVRMSMSIPFYWDEVIWQPSWGTYRGEDLAGHVLVDGGMVSNFPLHLMAEPTTPSVVAVMGEPAAVNPPLGLFLDVSLPVAGQPTPQASAHVRGRIGALLDTLMSARDNAVFDSHADRIVRLPCGGYGTTEFDMPDARVDALYQSGFNACAAWCDAHPHG